MNFFDQFKNKHLIAAHRGYRAKYPENTMLAFKKAIKRSDFIEFDVQFSKDNVPVVFHDDKLSRCSNINTFKSYKNKKDLYVCDLTYKELKKLDVSSWFYKKNPFSQKIKKPTKIERIPTLEKVLDFAKKHKIVLNLEIKYNKCKPLEKKQIKLIVDMIEEKKQIEKVLISSFHHEYIKIAKQFNSKISTAALAHKKYPNENLSYLKALKVDAYHINIKLATKKHIQEISTAGITVNVYTVNQKEKILKLFKYGVRTIFSDFLSYTKP